MVDSSSDVWIPANRQRRPSAAGSCSGASTRASPLASRRGSLQIKSSGHSIDSVNPFCDNASVSVAGTSSRNCYAATSRNNQSVSLLRGASRRNSDRPFLPLSACLCLCRSGLLGTATLCTHCARPSKPRTTQTLPDLTSHRPVKPPIPAKAVIEIGE